jgi:hypothetical protein
VEQKKPFDPTRLMRPIRTKNGMVQHLGAWACVMWVRHDHPTAQIVTEIVLASDNMAQFRCTITLPNGAIAIAHAQESAAGFAEYFEKAETSAISRACRLLGYGTESAIDLEEREPSAPAAADDRAQMKEQMVPSAIKWFRTELPRRGMSLPGRFERWGDVIGVLTTAGHDIGGCVDERGIDYAAIKALVEGLPIVQPAPAGGSEAS